VATPDFREKLLPGLAPQFVESKAFAEQIASEQAMYRKLVTDLNIKLD
jgi:hypothetical protein